MSEIRPLTAADVPAVADLFQRVILKQTAPAPHTLSDYLMSLFLEAPDQDPEIRSQIYVKPGGSVTGFMGALALPMSLNGTPLRAAIGSCLMVDGHADDPVAGARLLRTFLSGPQDISLGETASDITDSMWRKLRGIVLPSYSLDWFRLINPAGFLVELLANRSAAARSLSPLARFLDRWARRRASGPELRWSSVPIRSDISHTGFLTDSEIDDEVLYELIPRFTASFSLHPRWSQEGLRRILKDAAEKKKYGRMTRRMVTMRDGTPVGAFIYHGDPGRIGHVLQVLATPGHAGSVVDHLIGHAAESGLVALQGRTQPALLDAMLTRRCAFTHRCSTVVHSRNPALLKPFLTGDAFFNGLAGEAWTRLIGDDWNKRREFSRTGKAFRTSSG
ncbi:hypothetical protein [Microvirga sp. 2TAF3]|uniref:hypothetical protein n=1 Tax=Microvirga sp. 2TAF3 TaxID=3233014 RepID=UPI003F9909C9